jgi:exonuclease III
MRFRLWNVRSLYRADSIITVSRELSRYKLDVVGVQEVRWEGGGTERVGNTHFSTGFLCKRESYQRLRGLSLLVTGCYI